MPLLTILGISVGLSMDAFTVAISYGCSPNKIKFKHKLLISFSFGLFQALMPVIGWKTGRIFADMITAYDHWIAFALLSYIGIRMIFEGFKNSHENSCSTEIQMMDFKRLFILSLATSIDALAVGISLSLIGYDILFPAVIIGITTFILSYVGVALGSTLQGLFGKKVEILGGIILIIIGLKIIFEHML